MNTEQYLDSLQQEYQIYTQSQTFWLIFFIGYIVYGLVCGFFCARVMQAKGYNEIAWFFGGFFFGIFALIAAAGMPMAGETIGHTTDVIQGSPQEHWKCPECDTLNPNDVYKCQSCGFSIN